jgi:GNAT superfamily N-acetyltransferase
MNIRVALNGDLEHIAGLHTKSWRTTYMNVLSKHYLSNEIESDRLQVWSERLQNPAKNQIILVAEERQKFLGFACLYLNSDSIWGALLDNLHVIPEMKGKGIGKSLMQEVVRLCINQIGLYLWVLEINIYAQSFYKKLGATESEIGIWHLPGGGATNTLRYTWSSPICLGK